MRKIIFRGYAKTVGTDFAEAALYPDDTPDSVIDDACWWVAVENAQMYGYELSDDDEEDYDNYCTADDIGSYWEEYDPEAHDMLRIGGGSFDEDFLMQENPDGIQ